MDAKTLARIAHVNIGTLNVWAHRGFLPGLEPGVRGRRRNIDVPAATRVLIFRELVRARFMPDHASQIVSMMTDEETEGGFLLFAPPDAYVDAESDGTPPRPALASGANPPPQPTQDPPPPSIRRRRLRRRRRRLRRAPWAYVDTEPGGRFIVGHVRLHGDIDVAFQNLLPNPPSVYVVIDVGQLAERVRHAEREWEQSRRGNQADG
jgi:hypothetical protein